MKTEVGASLRNVRADWLRLQSEVAWMRMLFAADAYKQALQRRQKFNPYHDDAGRFTTADGVGSGGGEQKPDGRVRVAQAGNGTGYPINILQEDQLGGHTFSRHVNKPEEYLKARILESRTNVRILGLDLGYGDKRAGSFASLEAANKLVSSVLAEPQNQVKLQAFIERRLGYLLPFVNLYPATPFTSPTGYEAYAPNDRSQPVTRSTFSVQIHVRRTDKNEKGYYVHTALPMNED